MAWVFIFKILLKSTYSTARLQGDIRTHPERMQDMSRMHVRRVRNAREMCLCKCKTLQ